MDNEILNNEEEEEAQKTVELPYGFIKRASTK